MKISMPYARLNKILNTLLIVSATAFVVVYLADDTGAADALYIYITGVFL